MMNKTNQIIAIEMTLNGKSISEIASHLDVAEYAVRSYQIDLGSLQKAILSKHELLKQFESTITRVIQTQLVRQNKKWLNKEEVLELLDVSERTLQTLRDQRRIPFSQHGRRILYPRDGIEKYLNQHLVEAKV